MLVCMCWVVLGGLDAVGTTVGEEEIALEEGAGRWEGVQLEEAQHLHVVACLFFGSSVCLCYM